jgi:hypothetical protein
MPVQIANKMGFKKILTIRGKVKRVGHMPCSPLKINGRIAA